MVVLKKIKTFFKEDVRLLNVLFNNPGSKSFAISRTAMDNFFQGRFSVGDLRADKKVPYGTSIVPAVRT